MYMIFSTPFQFLIRRYIFFFRDTLKENTDLRLELKILHKILHFKSEPGYCFSFYQHIVLFYSITFKEKDNMRKSKVLTTKNHSHCKNNYRGNAEFTTIVTVDNRE